MGEHHRRKGGNFWWAGKVDARKSREKPERGSGSAGKEGPASLRSNKRVRFEEEKTQGGSEEQAEKGRKALKREDKREYHEAVSEERRAEEDGERRESRNTGGSSGSDEQSRSTKNNGDDEEVDEGREPGSLASPEGPSKQERETTI